MHHKILKKVTRMITSCLSTNINRTQFPTHSQWIGGEGNLGQSAKVKLPGPEHKAPGHSRQRHRCRSLRGGPRLPTTVNWSPEVKSEWRRSQHQVGTCSQSLCWHKDLPFRGITELGDPAWGHASRYDTHGRFKSFNIYYSSLGRKQQLPKFCDSPRLHFPKYIFQKRFLAPKEQT